MSTLKADTIVASDGSSPATLTKQSAAKAFCNIELDDTVKDSFNATSFTDNGTGDITHTLGSAMSNKNHTTIGFNIRNNTGGTGWCGGYGNSSDTSSTSTTARIYHLNASNVPEDMRRAMMVTHGDLA
tara:strand:+ start:303 stop:686 length:384 start_codon:yes stop_codon:yes gene_type:complete